MKKNLRIVSAAAAALLAVAPVAASAVSVNAADSTATTTANTSATTNSNVSLNLNGAGNTATNAQNTVNVSSSFSLNAPVKEGNTVTANATFGGELTANLNGTSVSLNVANAAKQATIVGSDNKVVYSWDATNNKAQNDLNTVTASQTYTLTLKGVGFSFGNSMAGKTVSFNLPKGATLKQGDKTVTELKLDQFGNATDLTYTQSLTAYDQSNTNAVFFINKNSGTTETKGLYMDLAQNGKMNVTNLLNKLEDQYNAVQYSDKKFNPVNITTDAEAVKAELKKQNITVDNAGNFEAPDTFTVTLNAKSNVNGKTASLPVTVSVPNGKKTTVASQEKTIMHNAYYYDKDAKRVGTDKVTRYNKVTVATSTTKIGDKTYYEVIENGKATGKYINADNIDGTKRTLKHNAYVYATSKKRANKVVLKKGEEVTTYGGTYTFKNGKQYYKIGNDTKKTYVKASNF
ncbi:S-layer protein [Lactobacillus crispatus]|uniref:SLAP domain-containing protein n=1 Tax=Lactobacillus crispatus TaxID=47770 RepID=UPI0018E39429|nr:SLAP domain-containing protein [Lactobacillus crispatus]MBI1720460.1 S-layer protein [Lactobacillus crispatus]